MEMSYGGMPVGDHQKETCREVREGLNWMDFL
jgi:hypothetical protein